MDNRDSDRAPFDERAALADLERLRLSIEHYKAQRRALGEEFDEFIRSFKNEKDVPSAAERPSPRAIPAAPVAAAAVSAAQRPTPPPPIPAPAPVMPTPVLAAPAPPPARANTVRPRLSPSLLGGLLILLAVAGAGLWSLRGVPRSATAPATQTPAATSAPPATTAPVAEPVTGSSIITTRAVWVRVLADGERVVERELKANTRVPLKAVKTIVIRTGDAGAVRVTINGQEQKPLGRDGEVVTRTFAIPSGGPR
jgi:cytoskeleton protein RodZ